MLGLLGFSVMYVSLCGPHSFDTSTFMAKRVEPREPLPFIGPFCARYRYLSHHVGLWEPPGDWSAVRGRAGDVASGTSRQATASRLAANATCIMILGIA